MCRRVVPKPGAWAHSRHVSPMRTACSSCVWASLRASAGGWAACMEPNKASAHATLSCATSETFARALRRPHSSAAAAARRKAANATTTCDTLLCAHGAIGARCGWFGSTTCMHIARVRVCPVSLAHMRWACVEHDGHMRMDFNQNESNNSLHACACVFCVTSSSVVSHASHCVMLHHITHIITCIALHCVL